MHLKCLECLFCKTQFLSKKFNGKILFSYPIIINFVKLYEANNQNLSHAHLIYVAYFYISQTNIKYPILVIK